MTASTITIVTKNTPQSYTGGTTAAAKGTALSVFEVDSNFINLKEGIIQVETDLANTDASIRSYINSNFVQSFSPAFTGTPTAPNPGGTGASQLQTVTAVNDLLSPITSTVNSATIGNQALANSINLKADLNSPLFTGYPRLTGTSYNFTTWDPVNQYLAPVEYVHDKLENLSDAVKPATAGGADLGTSTEYFNELHVNTILPAGSSSSLGTDANRFDFAYIEELHVGENTIFVGDAQISADGSTLVVPVNTAIGDQENVLPLNIASTTVDKRFAQLSLVEPLDQSFTASGAISARDPVAINSDGTVSTISSSVSNLNFVGIALAGAADTASVSVRIHGEISGFAGLTEGGSVFAEDDGTLVQTKTSTSLKIGTAISATEVMLFTTSNLDTYLLNIKKTELSDFSATTAGSSSGTGGLSYNSSTGQFTFTPADTSSFATTSYVDTEIANLVSSAPTSLDTLDELAAALNDDANFASTVTNSLAAKAPLASPGLTGTPTAPTASSGTNSTQIATTAYVQSEISGLGNASLSSFSVTSNTASGGGSLSYNNTSGVFTYTPPDLSSALTTETDPVVGAVTGIVKADGNGNITAAIAGTDYSTFDGAFSSLTGKPTTIAGYGITDAAPLASPAFTGTPTAPTAGGGTSTTQIATTAFVQNAVTAGSGIQLTDLSVSTNTASGQGALGYNSSTGQFTFTPADTSSFGNASLNSFSISTTSASGSGSLTYNNTNGVFSFTPADLSFSNISSTPTTIAGYGITDAFDGAFSSLTGTPTTVSGYGITDAAPLASPTFTGTPAAPTAASGTNTTQLATTAFVQSEISGFSSTGGDSQIDFIADGAITEGTAVTLGATTGEVTAVATAPVAGAHARLVNSSNSQHYHTQKDALDYNDQDGVYQQFYQNTSGQTVGVIWNTNLATLTFSPGTPQTLLSSLTPDKYFHINGTSTGILKVGTNSYIVTNSSGTLSIGPANNVGAYSKIITTEDGDLIALNGSDCHFVTVSGTTITFGSAIAIGLTPDYGAFEWSKLYNKLVAASLSSGTVTYSIGTISGTNITWSTAATNTTWAPNGNQIFYHVGSEMLISSRRHYWYVGAPVDLKMRSSTFNGSTFAFASNAESIVLSMGPGNNNANYYITAHTIKCSKTDDKFGILTKYDNGTVHRALASVSTSGVFANELGATQVIERDYGSSALRFPAGENDPAGYLAMVSSDRDTFPSNNSNIYTSFFRTSATSTKDSYLGIAQSTVADGDTVTVMLAGAISDVHSSLTPDTTMYVQDNGTISTTVSTVIAGKALNATSIQVSDSRGTFDKPVTFSTITEKPTTLSGYGITDGASTLSNIDIGSNDFITTGKSYFANMFATTGDLPSATTYHGMFAHVHGTGAGYFAHAGNWVELANKSYVDTEVANLVDSAPGTLDTLNELAAALGDDANFSTTITNNIALKAPLADPALTGTPTAPTATSGTNTTQIATTAFVQQELTAAGSYNDASVDTHLNTSTASSGEVLSWNGTDYDWVAQSSGGGGGASVTVSDAAPTSPSAGDLWFDSTGLVLYVYYNDGDSSQWVQTNPSGSGSSGSSSGGASVTVSGSAPTSPSAGDLWFDDDDLFLYVYVNDGSSSQWVKTNPSGGGSSSTWSEKTAAYAAVAGDKLIVDTSTAVTVTLPTTAVLGDEIRIIDGTGSASTNNITVARNGHNIEGSASDLTVDVDRAAFGLVYYNATQGWIMMER